MAGYRLSEEADARIDDIYERSILDFGPAQAARYVTGLWDALKALGDFPGSGVDCTNIRPGLRRRGYGSHMIYYRMRPNDILIVDILHQSMMPQTHLPPEGDA